MRRKQRTGVKFLALLLVALANAAGAQDFRIRAKVDLVEVPVTVKGSDDRLITGLAKGDFVVREDGRPQTITNFTIDPVPLSAAIVLDTGLTAGSLTKIQQTLPSLAGAFSEFDEVAVYRYDKFVTRILDFTQSAEHVETAMKSIRELQTDARPETNAPRSPFSVPGPVINGAPVVPPGQIGVVSTSPPKTSRVLHDALFTAASDLAKRERSRRKIVLLVSDGETSGSELSFEEASRYLLERGVQVYAVGLDRPFPFGSFSVLEDYAKTTGGDLFTAGSVLDIENAYFACTEAARNQYVLGYMSNNEVVGAGPAFRNIEVQVVGKNLKTLHRRGYYQFP